METLVPFSYEILFSSVSFIFCCGGYFTILKKLELKMKEVDKDLRAVITSQAVQEEKLYQIEKMLHAAETNNISIIKLLRASKKYE